MAAVDAHECAAAFASRRVAHALAVWTQWTQKSQTSCGSRVRIRGMTLRRVMLAVILVAAGLILLLQDGPPPVARRDTAGDDGPARHAGSVVGNAPEPKGPLLRAATAQATWYDRHGLTIDAPSGPRVVGRIIGQPGLVSSIGVHNVYSPVAINVGHESDFCAVGRPRRLRVFGRIIG